MSPRLMLVNTILSMKGSFNITDIQNTFDKLGCKFELKDINDILEEYVNYGLINENGFNYKISTL